jgi:apolipoprotein N-acyltransferase
VRRFLLALAGGAALSLAFPGYGQWWVAPVSVAALALATVRTRARAGFSLGLAFGLAFLVPTLSWSGSYLGIVPWAALAVCQSLYFALLGWGSALLQRRGVRPLVVALAWVAQEALRDRTPYGGFPWVRLAFSQADSPLGHVAAVGGAPTVTFLVALAGGFLGYAAHAAYPITLKTPRTPAGRAAVLRAGAAAAGCVLAGFLVPLPTAGPTARIMAIQGNVPRPGLDFNAERRRVLDNHVSVTVSGAQRERDAGAPTPDLVVWPENASDIDPTRNPDAAAAITQAVTAVGAPILLGGLLEEPAPQVSNVSLLYRPGAGLVGRYAKQHPVPFAEYIPNRSFWRIFSTQVDLLRTDMWAGPGPVVFRVPAASGGDVVAGPSICFEVAYDDLVRANVDLGANLLVVQTNNATFGFTHESVQQLAISRIRAIEHGRSVAHVSTVGVSALILPDGTLLQPTTLFTPAALVADLPVRLERTLADRLGAWPEYCAVFGMLALLVGTALSRRRRKDLTSP